MNTASIEAPVIGNALSAANSNSEAAHSKIAAGNKPHGTTVRSTILRFAKSERILHWCIAGPFLVSFATGMILAVVYNPDPTRPWRDLFSGIHRVSGIALALFPLLALMIGRYDVRIHLYNIKQAWIWVYDDFKWLALMGLAAISSRIQLPEQGKFNAAEKLNFMVLMSTYPLYVITGILMWLTPLAVLSWILHFLMALLATPLVIGHLYMALFNPSTRPGLEGMKSGHVDRQWAKHHYRRWYRAHHEASEEALLHPRIIMDPGAESLIYTVSVIVKAPGVFPGENSLYGILPHPIDGHLIRAMSPGQFFHLYDKLISCRAPAFGKSNSRTGSFEGSWKREILWEYQNLQALFNTSRILWTPEDARRVVTVKARDCVLTQPNEPLFLASNGGKSQGHLYHTVQLFGFHDKKGSLTVARPHIYGMPPS